MPNIRHAEKKIDQPHMRVQPEHRPTEVYFKAIRKGPSGILRRALSKCLPSWAVLGLCFVGGSILKVIADVRHIHRLTGTLKVMEIIEVHKFDIEKAAR